MHTKPFRSFFLFLGLGLMFLAPGCKSEKKAKAPKETASKIETKTADSTKPVADALVAELEEKPVQVPDTSMVMANPFFYEVKSPNGTVGHLIGTMHMGIDAQKELGGYVWNAINNAKTMVLEADISDVSLAQEMILPKTTNLKKELGDKTWILLVEALGEPTANMLMPMKPSAAAATLAIKGLPMTVPMDMLFMNKAKEKGATLDYLETGKFQMDLLNSIMDAAFLTWMLEHQDEGEDATKLLSIYRLGDEQELLKSIMEPKAWGKDFKKNIEAMLFARNDNWIPKLEKLFAQERTVVGVGAAHLVGPRGVLAQLSKKGFTLTRLNK